jgi:hypothetical protein
MGEVAAVQAIAEATKGTGRAESAIVQELLAGVLAMARGLPGRLTRHSGIRYRAIVELLDRFEGKNPEREQPAGEGFMGNLTIAVGKADEVTLEQVREESGIAPDVAEPPEAEESAEPGKTAGE